MEMMGNPRPTRCTLLEKLPVIKTRALKEDEANQDGLSRTVLFWRVNFGTLGPTVASITTSTLLASQSLLPSFCTAVKVIFWLIALTGSTTSPSRLKCLIAVHASDTKKRAQLMKEFKKDIEEEFVVILACECSTEVINLYSFVIF